MLSTTRGADLPLPRRRRRDSRQGGQILVIFTGGLIAFLAIAALVFDVGQNLLDWRAQRDAADAAALAGSRYIADAACEASPSIVNCPAAYQAAMHVARLNGYGDLDGNGTNDRGRVDVHIPPQPGRDPLYAGQPGFLEVNIHTDRPSFFAAVLGMVRQNVDAMAIAGNSNSVAPPYSMLALNTDCDPNPSGQVNGNGGLAVSGPIVVNSNCEGALQVGGNGSISAPECSVVGTTQVSGSNAVLNCDIVPTEGTGDPLANIGPGAMPGTPAAVQILSWTGGGTATIPAGCPGSYVQISVVGSSIGAGDARTPLPAFAAGDLAVVFAYRSGSDAPPDLPAGWTDIVSTTGADLNSRRIGFRTLDGTETSTGTWTNATAVALIILRGHDTDTPIGLVASAGSGGTTLTTPALTPLSVGGRSTVIAFAGAASGANLMTLAGATALSTSITPPLGLHYQRDIGTWAQQTYGGGPATGPNRTDAVEILANPNPSTAANPAGCRLNGAGGGKYNVYRIYPGVYYGGLSLGSRARVYMAPGTYWLAGGGLRINGQNAQLISAARSRMTRRTRSFCGRTLASATAWGCPAEATDGRQTNAGAEAPAFVDQRCHAGRAAAGSGCHGTFGNASVTGPCALTGDRWGASPGPLRPARPAPSGSSGARWRMAPPMQGCRPSAAGWAPGIASQASCRGGRGRRARGDRVHQRARRLRRPEPGRRSR